MGKGGCCWEVASKVIANFAAHVQVKVHAHSGWPVGITLHPLKLTFMSGRHLSAMGFIFSFPIVRNESAFCL